MSRIVIIDDNASVLETLERALSPEFEIETINPQAGEGALDRLTDLFTRPDGRVALIDIQWAPPQPSEGGQASLAAISALDVLSDCLVDSECSRPANPVPVWLITGYDPEKLNPDARDAGALKRTWNATLTGFLIVRDTLTKPLDHDQIGALLREEVSSMGALKSVVDAMTEPARVISGDGEPTYSNEAWFWELTEPAYEGPGPAGPEIKELLGVKIAARTSAEAGPAPDYLLLTSEPIGEGKRRIQHASQMTAAEMRLAEPTDTLRAIAGFAAKLGFDQLRYYERIRHRQAEGEDRRHSHIRLRASYRVRNGKIEDNTPHDVEHRLQPRFFIDRSPITPVISRRAEKTDERTLSDRQISPDGQASPTVAPIESPASTDQYQIDKYLSIAVPPEIAFKIDDGFDERPSWLLFEPRRARSQLESIPDPDVRDFLKSWNALVGVDPETCWVEIPVLMNDGSGRWDTVGWLVLQHESPAPDLEADYVASLRRKIEKREVTFRSFCIKFSHLIREERAKRRENAHETIHKFYSEISQCLSGEYREPDQVFRALTEKAVEWSDADYGAFSWEPGHGRGSRLKWFARRIRNEDKSMKQIDLFTPDQSPEFSSANFPAMMEALRRRSTFCEPAAPPLRAHGRSTSRLAAPIMLGEDLVGSIGLVSLTPWSFDEWRLELLEMLIAEGLAIFEICRERLDRYYWEANLIHQTNSAANSIRRAVASGRTAPPPEGVCREFDRIDAELDELGVQIASFAEIYEKPSYDEPEIIDVCIVLEDLARFPHSKLCDALHAEHGRPLGKILVASRLKDARASLVAPVFSHVMRVLLSNAVEHGKFTPDSDAICIEVDTDPDADDRLRIRVTNPGRIAEEEQSNLFKPFAGDRMREGHGLKMGLAAAKQWCDRFEAKLCIENSHDAMGPIVVATTSWRKAGIN